jgi:hypothetical protein
VNVLAAALTGIYDPATPQNAVRSALTRTEMSLFEWLGENRNPGPLGTIESGSPQPGHGHPKVVMLRAAIAIVLIAAAGVGIARVANTASETIAILVAAVVYCGFAYWLTPRPQYDNVGWAGGLIDHPFRWSDDLNRGLVFLSIILWPGRFLTVSLRDVVRYYRGQRVMILPPR